jgi:Cu+-exporting ATPase
MSATEFLVVGRDVILAVGLGWWFFGPRPTTEAAESDGVQEVLITVRGGYTPNRIRARAGVPLTARRGWCFPISGCQPICPPSRKPVSR